MRPSFLPLALTLIACGASIEDKIDQLSSGGEDLERAKQELLLSKDQSLDALLEAFDDPLKGASRPELAEVLVSLSLRLENEQLDLALDDSSSAVCSEAFGALDRIADKLSAAEIATRIARAQELRNHGDRDVRFESRRVIADRVDEWLNEAAKEILLGQVAAAESLFTVALDYSPESLKASFDYGRFLFDNGRREKGLDVYRRSGWLLDVPYCL